jgi:hypothetical protein
MAERAEAFRQLKKAGRFDETLALAKRAVVSDKIPRGWLLHR